jgi:hypothetical protein
MLRISEIKGLLDVVSTGNQFSQSSLVTELLTNSDLESVHAGRKKGLFNEFNQFRQYAAAARL